VRITDCSAIFSREKHRRFWVLLPFALAAIIVWQVPTASPVSPHAKTKVNRQDGLTYVWIPPGTFQMGCSSDDSDCKDNERPAHSVTLTKGIWIGQTPVTQAAYKKVVGSNPSTFKGDPLPVEQISWDDAKAYCEGAGMRLPTEAEWEYAARGGSFTARYAPLDQIAWYGGNSSGTTHEAGQKHTNGYGLYDMLGNVYEWVADRYEPYSAAGTVDPKGPTTGQFRVVRGAPWFAVASDVRVSLRYSGQPLYPSYDIGVRCAGD
jgi:formylglycine-generating enzyme required for sulfatase activity